MSPLSFRTFTFLLAIGSAFFAGMPHQAQAQAQMSNDQPVPQPPTNLRAHTLRQGVELKWDNGGQPGVSEFVVYRLENYSPSTTLKSIANVPNDARTPKTVVYDDTTTEYGHTYTYFLTSKNQFGGMSKNSQMTTINTQPPPPRTDR